MTTAIATRSTTYTKLRDGSWGLRGYGLTAGQSVTVSKRSGETKTETVGRILWTGDDGVQLATISGSRPAVTSGPRHYVRPRDQRRRDPHYAPPVPGCAACRQRGEMCKQCWFDEYDM